MKTLGWLWAWLHTYRDWAVTAAGVTWFVMYLMTWWGPFLVAAGVMAAAALAIQWLPKDRLRRVWLRVPWVMKYRQRKHRQWLDHVRRSAAMQRDIRRTAFCWGEALADIDPMARADFVHDLSLLDREMAQAATPDEKRKEQSSE